MRLTHGLGLASLSLWSVAPTMWTVLVTSTLHLASTFHGFRNGDGIEELYDYRADPAEELTNVAGLQESAGILNSMRQALARIPAGYETRP